MPYGAGPSSPLRISATPVAGIAAAPRAPAPPPPLRPARPRPVTGRRLNRPAPAAVRPVPAAGGRGAVRRPRPAPPTPPPGPARLGADGPHRAARRGDDPEVPLPRTTA